MSISRALIAALCKKGKCCLRPSAWRSSCPSSLRPTARGSACSSLIRLCVCLFLFEYELTPLIPRSAMHKYSLLRVFFGQLSQALVDREACRFFSREGLKRGRVWSCDTCPCFSLGVAGRRAPPPPLPSFSSYASVFSRCDKSYYAGETYSFSLC